MRRSFELCHIFTSGCWVVILGCVGIHYAFREIVTSQLGALGGGEVGGRVEEVLEVILLFLIASQWEQYPSFPLTIRQYGGLILAYILLLYSAGYIYPSYFCFGWLVVLCLCACWGGDVVVAVLFGFFPSTYNYCFMKLEREFCFLSLCWTMKKDLWFGALLHKISVNLV